MSTPGTRAHERLMERLRDRIRTIRSEDNFERLNMEADERRSKAIARRIRSTKTLQAA